MKIRINKKAVKVLMLVIAVVLVTAFLLTLLQRWDDSRQPQAADEASGSADLYENEDRALTYYNGAWYALREDIETFLIVGVDKFETDVQTESYTNSQQADFLLLLIREDDGGCTALQLNRDTMTEITRLGVTGDVADSYIGQLALAHTYGSGEEDSCENTAKAVSNLLFGVEVNHYLSLTMDAVALVNDLAGGVTVTVLDDLTGVDPSLAQGEEVTLMGEQALLYVRARQGLEDSTNLNRMTRQRQYLLALYRQIDAAMESDSNFLFNALAAVSPYMVSDCTIDQISVLANQMDTLEQEEILELSGESVLGTEYMEFYPDEDELQELVIRLFYVLADEA